MTITDEQLIENKYVLDKVLFEAFHGTYISYSKEVADCGTVTFLRYDYDTKDDEFKMDWHTNSGRIWDCHIDNPLHESIGWAEIDTTEQFDMLCQCVGIKTEHFIK